MRALLRKAPRRSRLLWPFLCVVIALAVLLLPGGPRKSLRLSLGPLVPPAQAGITFLIPNTCEDCHSGLRAVEEIHPLFALRCVDCHGGDDTNSIKEGAHVSRPGGFGTTKDGLTFPLTSGTHLLTAAPKELRGFPVFRSKLSPGGDDPTSSDQSNAALLAYRRFRNPGDLLVADQSCGDSGCHGDIVAKTKNSLHATIAGIMNTLYYTNGHPGATPGGPGDFTGTDADKLAKLSAVLPRGQALVDPNFDPTRLGTVPFISKEVPRNDQDIRNAKKSDQLGLLAFTVQTDCVRCHFYTPGSPSPGDWHSTGCSSCHVYYSSEAALSETFDDLIPKNETNHPKKHLMVRFPPTEQCAHCHNRGARVAPRFFGMRDAPQGFLGLPEFRIADEHGENNAGAHFDSQVSGLAGGFFPGKPLYFKPNDTLFGRPYNPGALTQGFALVKGFQNQALWRRFIFPNPLPQNFASPFYIVDEDRTNTFDETPPDIHGVRGMGCVDCHTGGESHGDGHIYSTKPHAVEVTCEMCHGSAFAVADFKTRFGNLFPGLFRDTSGRAFQRLKSDGSIHPLSQIKEVIDSGRNPNAQGPSHLLHGRVECWTCHATWHAQQFSRTSLVDYNTDTVTGDKPLFVRRGYSDNELRNAFQAGGEASFMTGFDELILGINHKGKIQNFDPAGLDFLWANKVAGPGANPADGNFLELSRCVGGQNDRGLCEVDADCPNGGTCPKLTCIGGPFAGKAAQAEGQCKQCTKVGFVSVGDTCLVDFDCGVSGGKCTAGKCSAVGPIGRSSPEDIALGFGPNNPSCSLDTDCGLAAGPGVPASAVGKCEGGTLSRVCFKGPNDGKPCTFDPSNPTSFPDCPGGTCGVRMFNFSYSTIDKNLHLPSFAMQPLFPHTVRKIPRNCDSCHLKPGFLDPNRFDYVNIESVVKALGLGWGSARVLDPGAPGGFRQINITRRLRIFTNGKGDLSITNPETGHPVRDGEEVPLSLDEFVEIPEFTWDGHTLKVLKILKTRPTPHVGTGPLDATAMEKMINNVVTPQIPSQPGP